MSWSHILLFPGVIVHELGHLLGCLLTGTRVSGVKLWGLKEAWVKHEEPGPFAMLIIAVFPFLLNSTLAGFLALLGHLALGQDIGLALAYYWLAVSLAYHAFPSLDDVNNAYSVLVKNWFGAMLGKKGLFLGLLAWIFFIPIFLPMLGLVGLLYIFSQIENLGLVWAVLILLFTAKLVGV